VSSTIYKWAREVAAECVEYQEANHVLRIDKDHLIALARAFSELALDRSRWGSHPEPAETFDKDGRRRVTEEAMSDVPLNVAPTDDLWTELVRRGAALEVGYCYPAMAAEPDATKLIEQHGYEYGPWQFIELGEPAARPPSWPLMAQVPEKCRSAKEGK
jgi:hypothetical protein